MGIDVCVSSPSLPGHLRAHISQVPFKSSNKDDPIVLRIGMRRNETVYLYVLELRVALTLSSLERDYAVLTMSAVDDGRSDPHKPDATIGVRIGESFLVKIDRFDVRVWFNRNLFGEVGLGFDAPREVDIMRKELVDRATSKIPYA